MTREEALALLASDSEVTLEVVSDIAKAFSLEVSSSDWRTEMYWHAKHIKCGAFVARDYGNSVLSGEQKYLLRKILECVSFFEQWGSNSNVRE